MSRSDNEHWEYCTVAMEEDEATGYRLPRYLNGEEIRNWRTKPRTLHGLMNELGRDGWELVAIYEATDAFLFKRRSR